MNRDDDELRDWFAGMALQAIIHGGPGSAPDLAAQRAYEYADAMLEARKK